MAKSRIIPSVVQPKPETLQISFRHIDCEHDRYSIDKCGLDFWRAFVREMKRYAAMQVDDFSDPNNKEGRHWFVPENTKEPEILSALCEALGEDSYPWQIDIGHRSSGHRAYGILVGSIFYLLWLDAAHDLYARGMNTQR